MREDHRREALFAHAVGDREEARARGPEALEDLGRLDFGARARPDELRSLESDPPEEGRDRETVEPRALRDASSARPSRASRAPSRASAPPCRCGRGPRPPTSRRPPAGRGARCRSCPRRPRRSRSRTASMRSRVCLQVLRAAHNPPHPAWEGRLSQMKPRLAALLLAALLPARRAAPRREMRKAPRPRDAEREGRTPSSSSTAARSRTSRRRPAGAKTLDLSASTCLPGLIDAHTHLLLQGDATSEEYDEQVLKESTPYRALRAAAAARDRARPRLHDGARPRDRGRGLHGRRPEEGVRPRDRAGAARRSRPVPR